MLTQPHFLLAFLALSSFLASPRQEMGGELQGAARLMRHPRCHPT
jgi:hypothetical protein